MCKGPFLIVMVTLRFWLGFWGLGNIFLSPNSVADTTPLTDSTSIDETNILGTGFEVFSAVKGSGLFGSAWLGGPVDFDPGQPNGPCKWTGWTFNVPDQKHDKRLQITAVNYSDPYSAENHGVAGLTLTLMDEYSHTYTLSCKKKGYSLTVADLINFTQSHFNYIRTQVKFDSSYVRTIRDIFGTKAGCYARLAGSISDTSCTQQQDIYVPVTSFIPDSDLKGPTRRVIAVDPRRVPRAD